MSTTKSFMQELDEWTNATVIVPLTRAVESGNDGKYHDAAAAVEKAIRAKVLESYRNGQIAGPKPVKR